MNRYLIIHKLSNSFGRGYSVRADGIAPEHCYYQYSKRDALRLYRDRYGLRGVHFQILEF